MQPGYPPNQGHQGYPGYQGYPPPPKKSYAWLIILLCAVGVLFLAGAGVGAYFLFRESDSKSASSSSSSSPSPSAIGPADKYAALPGCATIQSNVTGLPKNLVNESDPDSGTSDPDVKLESVGCVWDTGDSPFRVEVHLEIAKSVPGKTGAGTDFAKRYYKQQSEQGTPEGSVSVPGVDQSTRTSFSSTDCAVHGQMGNVYFVARYYADSAGAKSSCERDSLEVAKAVVQSVR